MTTTPLSTRLHTTTDAFSLPGWEGLVAGRARGQIFSTPEWNRVWWEEFGADKDLFLLSMHRDEHLVAVVPLYRKAAGSGRLVLRFVGGIDLTDYLGPICARGDVEDVADTLLSWLATTDVSWDEFDAHNLPVPSGFGEILVERADGFGLDFGLEQEETAALLRLPDDWDAYLAELSSKDRHELRRKRRKLERESSDLIVRLADESSLDLDLKHFVEMHRGADGLKGHFMKPEIATFFERVAHALMPLGWLRLHLLEVDGAPVAGTFGFVYGDTFHLYNSAYEPDAGHLSPGFVLVTHLIEEALAQGLQVFDLMRGSERYKYRLGAQAVPLNNVRISRTADLAELVEGVVGG